MFDSGAGISVISQELFPKLQAGERPHKIMGIGGSQWAGDPIKCKITLSSNWTAVHEFKPLLIPGKQNLVILGRDFLEGHGSTEFDWINKRVRIGENWVFMVSDQTEEDLCFIIERCKISPTLSDDQTKCIRDILESFCHVFVSNSKAPKLCTTEVHRILTKDDAVCKDKIRRLPTKWRGEISRQIGEMLENGIVRPSNSPHNCNPVLVDKHDKTKRFVIDFRTLNKHTIQDTYPLPDVNEVMEVAIDCNYLTQLDLASGYWCLEVKEEDRGKTAFSVPNGKYEFNRMPFGLKNAQASMQRMMDKVKSEVINRGYLGIDTYVDNVFIFTETFEEHIETLKAFFETAADHNLSLKPEKCELGFKEMDILGFHVGNNSVAPSKENGQKLLDFPVPNTKRRLQGFLGLANFNRRFIPHYAELTKPLTEILSDKVRYIWTDKQQQAFEKIKATLSSAPALGLPDFRKPFVIQSDASDVAVGGMLYQTGADGNPIVIGYHSKTLKKSQKNWTVTEKEFYGIKVCVEKWRVYCNNKVIFRTDHEPLKYIRKHKDSRGKIVRWILELESIDYTIEYVKGSDNTVADAMSRVEIPDSSDSREDEVDVYELQTEGTLDITRVKAVQLTDKAINYVVGRIKANKKVTKGPFRTTKGIHVTDGVLKKGEKIVVPESLQLQIIREIHGQYHDGIENTMLALRARFWWKGMAKQTEQMVQGCHTCLSCKAQGNPKAEMVVTDYKEKILEAISIDVGHMRESKNGNCCFLLIVDRASRFATVATMKNQLADTIKEALWDKWLSIFGIPGSMRSDQGRNVDGAVINELCNMLEIRKDRSTPYHPEGNGLAERSIGSVKTIVRLISEGRKIDRESWDRVIHEAVLAHNARVNKSMKHSPFSCLFGVEARLPVDNFMGIQDDRKRVDQDLVRNDARYNIAESNIAYKEQFDKNCRINDIVPGQEVMIKRNYGPHPKQSVKWIKGPFIVDKKIGPVNFAIRGPKGGCKIYHHNNLKPAGTLQEASHCVSFEELKNLEAVGIRESIPILGESEQRPEEETHPSVIEERLSVARALPSATEERGSATEESTVSRSSYGRIRRPPQFYGV